MSTITFEKYHGIGNDFLIFDGRQQNCPSLNNSHYVRAICDRRLGVGADGILSILPPHTNHAIASMKISNADGTVAEACGNGVRCVAHYLASAQRHKTIQIDTVAGTVDCTIHYLNESTNIIDSITVNMGKPTVLSHNNASFIDKPVVVKGQTFSMTAISMGNPHVITFTKENPNDLAQQWGNHIESHEQFPNKTNVEFARIIDHQTIELVVYERACGITKACGTGACAAVFAAVLTQQISADIPITVHLPGGTLSITVASDHSAIFMQGTATRVYTVDINLDTLMASWKTKN